MNKKNEYTHVGKSAYLLRNFLFNQIKGNKFITKLKSFVRKKKKINEYKRKKLIKKLIDAVCLLINDTLARCRQLPILDRTHFKYLILSNFLSYSDTRNISISQKSTTLYLGNTDRSIDGATPDDLLKSSRQLESCLVSTEGHS